MREGERDVMEITEVECMKRGMEGKELSLQDERDLQAVKKRRFKLTDGSSLISEMEETSHEWSQVYK